ncbi:farnesylcysteine lyase isoform X2 [Amborella trichopoda]|uniref:farnesylcysteine lyase isoform X2 n=1 Tax=Amborella trichopoda TaxID=13333 RepID=UPI0009BFC746|nr:farnesylcysteine lyase isoform X2 [Amborella trichopoda]|eukprot:XP_020522084.1 farnesylcysteine lyase isoform X2 [Amborella trichopoda]
MGMEKWGLLFSLFLSLTSFSLITASGHRVCIIGSGIGGSSAAHFLKSYSLSPSLEISVFERREKVGGRMATVELAGDTFEAGASILHPKNYHALNFTELLGLGRRGDNDDSWFGVWDGKGFVFKTMPPCQWVVLKKLASFFNSLLMFGRYGFSLLRMQSFTLSAVANFLKYYEDSRPIFESVEEMLKWAGLYGLTTQPLQVELEQAGLSDSGLWAVEGGNWQMAAGLIDRSNASLFLQEEIMSISNLGDYYELNSTKGNSYHCNITVVATPLDELNISFSPPISIPKRKLQHTHATFVRGVLNPGYFGLKSISEIPNLVGTVEVPDLPFSSISVLKEYSNEDKAYKVFSRVPMNDDLLDLIFSVRKEVVRINWAAYPHYEAPEIFAPIILDQLHLYYINSFENAASTMETSAVAAENVARLILSRLSSSLINESKGYVGTSISQERMHVDDL